MKTLRTHRTRKNKVMDDEANNGMMTYIWEPVLWFFLHTISFNYPLHPTNENKEEYKKFIYSLIHILPCKHCRNNLKDNLKNFPISDKDMCNRETFSKYVFNLHNKVNKMLNKNIKITYNEVRDRYENFRARCDNNTKLKPIDHSKGCTIPANGVKSKCILKIVPKNKKIETLTITKKCYRNSK